MWNESLLMRILKISRDDIFDDLNDENYISPNIDNIVNDLLPLVSEPIIIKTTARSTYYKLSDICMKVFVRPEDGQLGVGLCCESDRLGEIIPGAFNDKWKPENWLKKERCYRHQNPTNPQGPTFEDLPEGKKHFQKYLKIFTGDEGTMSVREYIYDEAGKTYEFIIDFFPELKTTDIYIDRTHLSSSINSLLRDAWNTWDTIKFGITPQGIYYSCPINISSFNLNPKHRTFWDTKEIVVIDELKWWKSFMTLLMNNPSVGKESKEELFIDWYDLVGAPQVIDFIETYKDKFFKEFLERINNIDDYYDSE